MINMDQKLIKRQEEGKVIKTGIVGAGQMGRCLLYTSKLSISFRQMEEKALQLKRF